MPNQPEKQPRVTVSGKVDLRALAVVALWLKGHGKLDSGNYSRLLAEAVEGFAEVLKTNGARPVPTYMEATKVLEEHGFGRSDRMRKDIFQQLVFELDDVEDTFAKALEIKGEE